MQGLEADCDLLIDAARQAGEIAKSHWRRDPQVFTKDDKSPVSEADLKVNDALARFLRQARPDYGWMSEESPDESARLSAERTFVLDPIDGTRAFIAGKEQWSISLAVVQRGQPVVGVVFLPARDQLYFACKGHGARLGGEKIGMSHHYTTPHARVLCQKPVLAAAHWRAEHEMTAHICPSLAYRFCLVAEGRYDAILSLRDAWDWDIAAGMLILSESGGVTTDWLGNRLELNQPARKSAGLIAANPRLHQAIRAAQA